MSVKPLKVARGLASPALLTFAIAMKSLCTIMKVAADITSAMTAEWIKNVRTGQSVLYNAHNSIFVAISEGFQAVGDRFLSLGTYGFKKASGFFSQEVQEFINSGGFGNTATDDYDIDDIAATSKNPKVYEERIHAIKKARERATRDNNVKMSFLLSAEEWLQQGRNLIPENDPLANRSITDPEAAEEYLQKLTSWCVDGALKLEDALNLSGKEQNSEKEKLDILSVISKATKGFLEIDKNGQITFEKVDGKIRIDKADEVISKLGEIVSEQIRKANQAINPTANPKPKDAYCVGPTTTIGAPTVK